MKLALCIVGCGGYAKTVLQHIGDMAEHLDLYFASRDFDKAREYSNMFGGVDVFGSYQAAAEDPRVDALYFLTPHHIHLENALLAARCAKHILIEKPIACTVAEGREMVEAARDGGVKLMVAENYRFLPSIRRSADLIARGVIGELRLIRIHVDGYAEYTDWRTELDKKGGGVFIDGGIHYVDVLVNLGGFPEYVYAATPRPLFDHVEGEDGLVMLGRLPNDVVGLISYSSGTPIRAGTQIVHLVGTKGQLSFSPYGNEVTVETPGGRDTIDLPQAWNGVPYMLEEFRKSIIEDREPLMSGDEGLKDLAVVLAAYESVSLKQEVAPQGHYLDASHDPADTS